MSSTKIKDPFKIETIRVRLSSSFMVRGRCKYCKGGPSIYFYTRNPTMWYNVRRVLNDFSWVREHVKQFTWIPRYSTSPINFDSITSFNHQPFYKGYRPRLHRIKGSNPVFDLVEFLSCDCMRTEWAYAEKAVENRPEIMARKSRKKYPKKFLF